MMFAVVIAVGIIFYMNKDKIAQAITPSTYPPYVRAISVAIATAEGYFAPGNTLPKRAHNPGDLERGDVGFGTINKKTVYANDADGWAALDHQVYLIVSGKSANYTPTMSISEVAEIYTGEDSADSWAAEVARSLGVSVDSSLGDYGAQNS